MPDEPPVAAGTELRVHSGRAADWAPAPIPGFRDRFVAETGDRGATHLPADRPVWLRIVDESGTPGHRRRFLSPGDFTAVPDTAVLRRADGCGIAVTVPGGPLARGTYRLTLTYRRNNKAQDPDSDILSRSGDESDEVVWLDIDI